jgi:hypothetical protein
MTCTKSNVQIGAKLMVSYINLILLGAILCPEKKFNSKKIYKNYFFTQSFFKKLLAVQLLFLPNETQ